MREIRLHDTRSGQKLALEPRDPGRIGIYSCGPTVYNRIHVGNARPYVVPSLLKRFLEHEGYAVTLVANVTDINDKIYDAARPLGVPSADLAREMTAHYFADTEGLGLGRPDREPLASETIEPIKDLIQALLDNGSAYAVDGDVYFRVRADPDYGSLSHRSVDDMDQGEGVEGSDRKEDPLDFALWKAQKAGEDTAWDAPWGRGRPGWHIECSAMAEEVLGVGFEIHSGGNDLTFPHHENEAAQTRRARGAELSRIWMHNGMLQMGGEKMAKSVGNITLAGRRAGRARPRRGDHVLRRRPLPPADPVRRRPRWARRRANVRRVREAARRLAPGPSPAELAPLKERFFAALADDFNTPTALAAVFDWVSEANRRDPGTGDADLREMLQVLALDNLLDARRRRRRARRRRPRAARAPRGRARGARLRRGRPPARRAGRAGLAGARLRRRPAARARRSVSGALVLYGRNPIREALRAGRRPVHRVWATRGAAAEPWLRDVEVIEARPEQIAAARGDRGPPGPVRRGRLLPLRGRGRGARAPRPARRRARRAPGPAEPRGDLPHRRMRRAPTRVVIPERRSAEVTPAVCKASAGAVEHLPIARVRNVADFLADGEGRRLLVLRRERRRAASPT